MSIIDYVLNPDGDDAVSQCARCHCSVPLYEWELVGDSFRHKGPRRDHDVNRFVVSDDSPDYDDENDQCGWVKRIPKKV